MALRNILNKTIRRLIIVLIRLLYVNKASARVLFSIHGFLLEKIGYGLDQSFDANGETFALERAISLLRKQSAFNQLLIFDVGANIGNYSKMLDVITDGNAKIYLFEPNPSVFTQLKNNLSYSQNFIFFEIAFGAGNSKQKLFFNEQVNVLSSLYNRDLSHKGIALDKQVDVTVTTIDDFSSKNGIDEIDLLKLDVEGNELAVIKGAENMILNKKVKVIQFEFGGTNIDSRTYFKDLFDFLSPLYKIYLIRPNELFEINCYAEGLEIFLTANFLAVLNEVDGSY